MLERNKTMCFFYTVSPMHAGSETSLGAVDLPIQREKHTGWPHVQASAVKGALRSHFRQNSSDRHLINYIFGLDDDNDKTEDKPEKKDGETTPVLPGAISVSDAKLLLFPVRSNIAPFVWITCPAQLKRFKMDMDFIGISQIESIPEVEKDYAIKLTDFKVDNKQIIMEDAVVAIEENKSVLNIDFLNNTFADFDMKKIILISDKMYKYIVENATEIQTHIKIDSKTCTASAGALRYEELLPADSLLYTVVYYDAAFANNDLKAENVRTAVENSINRFIQIGGDETLGRGICRVKWLEEV
ncbi:MAG: type III-B CRISPR module RAMP protein Cmr4 [Spirochaetales bacterium]|nr:type III-B CRISPR module RAMP protein Cmr4 [Spirochaetales bacterium]